MTDQTPQAVEQRHRDAAKLAVERAARDMQLDVPEDDPDWLAEEFANFEASLRASEPGGVETMARMLADDPDARRIADQHEWFSDTLLEIVAEFITFDDAHRQSAAQTPEAGEPVAWMYTWVDPDSGDDRRIFGEQCRAPHSWTETPLYAHPPATPEQET